LANAAIPAVPSAPGKPFSHRSLRLHSFEWCVLAAVMLGWAIMVVCRGKDESWDFRNYHWYVPYAFLNGRLGFDVAVAHQATYYNPFLDTPFYLLATHLKAWLALAILGAVQGANVVPIYFLCRSMLIAEPRRLLAGILALLSMTGSLAFYLAGSTYYDNVMSVFVLSGLALVLCHRETLQQGSVAKGTCLAASGAFLIGCAVGLKLPEAPFALGYMGVLLVLPGDWRRRSSRFVGGGIGGMLGFALFAAYWMVAMARLTGNPLFPYFNEFFHSPLALAASYRDVRFIPHGLTHQLLFPLLFSLDWRVADDLPFVDIRVGVAYVAMLAAFPLMLVRGRKREAIFAPDAALALFVFVAIAYVAWLKIFAIYRYILLLEMLAPLLIVSAIDFWPASKYTRMVAGGCVMLVVLATTKGLVPGRAPVHDPYVQATIPPIADPNHSMILMTGEEPLGYLAPSLPAQIPIIRIDGWMIQPQDGSELTARTKDRVKAFTGNLYLIASAEEMPRGRNALTAYGLAIGAAKCRDIVANLGGPYRFCPVTRMQSATP
jgi:hypothetical protein